MAGELEKKGEGIASAKMFNRSWKSGRGVFIRGILEQQWNFRVELKDELPDAKLYLHTNLFNAEGRMQDIELRRISAHFFSLDSKIEKAGMAAIRLWIDKGDGVRLWDSAGYASVLVDPPGTKSVRMYSFIPNVSGTFNDWLPRLREIREAGFDTIHFLPITALDKSESPYSAYDLFDVDESYMNPDDERPGMEQFRDIVEEAKKLGLRLCLDLVLNHIGINSKLVNRRPAWIEADPNEEDGMRRAGCWHHQDWISWRDLALLNHENPDSEQRIELWNYMKEYALFWGRIADETGGMLRLDNLHSTHPGMMTHVANEIRRELPNLILLGEFFEAEHKIRERVPQYGLNLLLANNWEYPFVPAFRDYLTWIHSVPELRHFQPIATHDTRTPAELFGTAASVIPRYLAAALMGTGQTGIVQGNEFGIDKKIEFIGRNGEWNPDTGHDFRENLKKINDILANEPAFHRAGNLRFVDGGNDAILAAYRKGESGENSWLVFANFDIYNKRRLTVPLDGIGPDFGVFCAVDEIRGERVECSEQKLSVILDPCGINAMRLVSS